jgi:hypothetical protein
MNRFDEALNRLDNVTKTKIFKKNFEEFKYLMGLNVNEIILFDNGTVELYEQGKIILPRYYTIFVGIKDGEIQFKPYEFDQYRIIVSTYKDIIMNIESIG